MHTCLALGEPSEEIPVLGFWAFSPLRCGFQVGQKMVGEPLWCVAKCAQAAKAFTKESVFLFLLQQLGAGFSSDFLGIG